MNRISGMPSDEEQVQDDHDEHEQDHVNNEEGNEVKKEMDDEVVVYSERSLRERKPKPPPPEPEYPILSDHSSRRRKANFSQEEKEFLVEEYKNYAHILRRNSDATLERRAQVWAKITKKFNKAVSEKHGYRAVRRTVMEVRKKWRAMCTQARKNKQDMADNGNTDGYHGWVTSDKMYELDNEIITLLGEHENEGCQSDDAWSEMEPDSPVETKWSSMMNQAPTPPLRETPRMPSNTLPVQAPKRSSYNAAAPPPAPPGAVPAQTGGNITPIIVHTQSLADPAFINHTPPPEVVDECDYMRKKRSLELERMQLENKLLRVQLAKATLEVQAMKAGSLSSSKQAHIGD